MIDPKTFYRKLDFLLNKIGNEKSGKDFLFLIVKELEDTFGKDLHLHQGRIYEENEDEYILISSPDYIHKSQVKPQIPITSPAIQNLITNKTYIFDDYKFSRDVTLEGMSDYSVPVGILVHSLEYHWIFLFELKSGWVREEIEFCLNAVRTALNHRLYAESIKNEMIQANLIQKSLLPDVKPEIKGFQIADLYQPAEIVGGDLYDYYRFDGEGFGVCIGDASGHGMPAALLVRDVVTGLRMGIEEGKRIIYTFKKLNRVIHRSIYSTRFISLFYCEMDRNGHMHYVNAGHPSPLLFSGEEVHELEPTGMIFGALTDIDIYQNYTKMETNSVLVLYTDAIIERKDGNGHNFGIKRLKSLIKQNQSKSANDILEIIVNEVNEFGKSKKWEDDATLIVIKKIG